MTDDQYQQQTPYDRGIDAVGYPDPRRITMKDIAKGLEGRKADEGKLRMDLIPPELLEGVASILTFGAGKYGERNWEQGMAWGRVYGALLRHLTAWHKGESADPETGKSHLWHVGCCIAFLIAYEARGIGTDDRPKVRA